MPEHAAREFPSTIQREPNASDLFVCRTQCPACTSKNLDTVLTRKLLDPNVRLYVSRKVRDPQVLERFGDTPYALLECQECELIFQQYILSDAYLSLLYGEWVVHGENHASMANEPFSYYSNELFTIASLFNKPPRDIKVLDYGVGGGKWAKIAASLGFDVYGTDLSHEVLNNARSQGIKVIEYDKLEDHRFDFINTEQVFEHLARPREALSRLIGLLDSDGVVKISVPDGKDIKKRLPLMDWSAPRGSKRYLVPVTPLVHINTFKDSAIEHLGRSLGLNPVRPKLRDEYQIVDMTSARQFVKSVGRPIYRRFHGAAYVFLRKAA